MRTDRPQPLRIVAGVALAGYWLALVIGTHLPALPSVVPLEDSDKVLHFLAYAGLAMLVTINGALRRTLGWPHWFVIAGLLALFGALDEVTQIPVGRHCDFRDWLADAAGIVSGLALFAGVFAACRRLKKENGGP
jgi:VanZ family protein